MNTLNQYFALLIIISSVPFFAHATTSEDNYAAAAQACYNYVNAIINSINGYGCTNGASREAQLTETPVTGGMSLGYIDSNCGSPNIQPYQCGFGFPTFSPQELDTQQSTNTTGTKKSICGIGSVIDVSNQSVAEQIPIARAPFALNYSSEYNPNRAVSRSVQMNYNFLQGTAYPHQAVITSVTSGQNIATLEFPALPVVQTNWVWDGTTGADISNPFLKEINLNITLNSEMSITGLSEQFAPADVRTQRLVVYNPSVWGLGGWTLSNHHYFDRVSQTIFWGTGSKSQVTTFKTISLPAYGTVDLVISSDGSEIYLFDSLGRHVETRTAFLGVTKYKFTYDSNNRLANIQDINGGLTVFNRDGNGKLVSVQPAMGPATLIATDSNGNILSAQDPNGFSYTMNYDSNSELLSFQKPDGLSTQFTYDSSGNFIREDKNNGLYQQFVDSTANLIRSISHQTPVGTLDNYQISESGDNQQVTHTDGQGRTIDQRTDTATNSVINSADEQLTINYSNDPIWGDSLVYPSNSYSNITNGSNIQTLITKQAQLSDPTNPLTLTSMTQTWNQYPSVVTTVMDVPSRTTTVTDSSGDTYTYLFDQNEKLVQITENLHTYNYKFQYNSVGQLIQYTDNFRKIYQYSYNQNGDLTSVLESGSPAPTQFTYDNDGRVTRKTFPNGDTVNYAYTPTGALQQLTTPSGQVYNYQLGLGDIFSQAIAPMVSIFHSVTTSYNYDNQKRIQTINLPSGKSINYAYQNGTNYIQSITASEGQYQFNGIDANGRVNSAISPDGIQSNLKWVNFDIAEEQWLDTDGSVIATLDYQWAQQGRLSEAILNGNQNIESFGYDDVGRISESFSIDQQSLYTYSATNTNPPSGSAITEQSNNLSVAYSWGPGTNEDQFTTNLTDDKGDTLLINFFRSFSGQYASSVANGNFLYIYNVNGVSQALNSVYQEGYNYDANQRLTGSSAYRYVVGATPPTTETYAMNYAMPQGSNGNIAQTAGFIGSTNVSTTNTYDAQDRLLKVSGSVNRTYAYDDDGNITSMKNCYGTTTYQYDEFSNLKQVTKPDGTVIQYKVDAFNRRIKKIVNGQTKEYYIWYQDSRLAAVLDQNKNPINEYSYGPISRTPTTVVHNGIPYKILVDPDLGSVRYVVEPGYGKVMQEIEYDAYGNMLSNTNPNFQPLTYAGGLFDSDTNLIRFGARDYDPTISRWLTKDPLGFGGGDTNLYNYVGNNPVNAVDPSGLSDQDVNNIRNAVNNLVVQLTNFGMRYPGNGRINGDINNFLASIGSLTNNAVGNSKFMGCIDQSKVAADVLSTLKTDDSWRFAPTTTELGTHHVLTGHSSNTNDPILIIDPWKNSVTLGK